MFVMNWQSGGNKGYMKRNKKLVVLMSMVLVILVGIAAVLFTKSDKDIEKDKLNASTDGSKAQVESQEEDSVSTIDQQILDEESYVIETDYVRLYYPQKWEDNLETEVVEDEGYVVEFYGKVEGKERQKIFEVIFNGDADIVIGTVENNGENIYVGFNLTDLELGDDWTDEEADVICAMQEDVNYLIGMLEREAGFEAE